MSEIPPKVLVVDDEPFNVRVLRGILEKGHEVLAATSGAEALELAVAEAPEVVLLDVMMPGLDGYEVCRRLKDDPRTRGIPVVFVAARDDDGHAARGFEIGGADYIVKPVSPPVVRARVRNQVELKRYRDRFEELSWCDALTGIANRRRFDAYLEHEWQRARRSGSRLWVLLADIDGFKTYNDRYGHLEGDRCLREIAAVLGRVVHRSSDLLARYGGEEFACILPDTHADGAAAVAGALRDGVAEHDIEHPPGIAPGRVSVSVGVAGVVPRKGMESADLLAAADRSLHAAKARGRNRVGPTEPVRVPLPMARRAAGGPV